MNRAICERGRERVINEPVLLDERKAGKTLACDCYLEVVATTGAIDDRDLAGLGKRLTQKILEAGGHPRDDTIGVGG